MKTKLKINGILLLKRRIQSIATNKKDDQIESDTDIKNDLYF